MALVACRECGAEVSDSAPNCPRCGVAAPAGTATLVFHRPGLGNSAIGLEVFVDGQPYGSLRGLGGKLAVDVAPGNHHVELRTSQGKSGVGTVRVGSGETVVTVKLSMMGSPKIV